MAILSMRSSWQNCTGSVQGLPASRSARTAAGLRCHCRKCHWLLRRSLHVLAISRIDLQEPNELGHVQDFDVAESGECPANAREQRADRDEHVADVLVAMFGQRPI